MASYEIVSVIPSERLEANGLTIVPTIELVGSSVPHAIGFSVTVDKTEGWKARLEAAAEAEALELESLFPPA